MKSSIEWHKKSLANFQASYDRRLNQLRDEEESLYFMRVRLEVYRGQVERAEKEGKADFDPDKFNVKRARK